MPFWSSAALDAAPFSGAASVSPARGSPRWRSARGAPGVSPGPPATPGGCQEHGRVVAGLGTWPRGRCTQHGPPGSRELGPSSRCVPRRTASPRHGHTAREATSRSPAPGWGQFVPCPRPIVSPCPARGPEGQQGHRGRPAPPPAVPAHAGGRGGDTRKRWPGAERGAKRWQKGKNGEKRPSASSLGRDAAPRGAAAAPSPPGPTEGPDPALGSRAEQGRAYIPPKPQDGAARPPQGPQETHRSGEAAVGGRAPRSSPGLGEPGEERTSPG